VAETPEVPVFDGDGLADAELWASVRVLPPKQRTAVMQRYLLDRPYAEVAAVVGCSEDAARQNVRAGLARLRAVLTPERAQEVTS
jgi:DNA-directed RNA polymerase specialized sigma24 family protein